MKFFKLNHRLPNPQSLLESQPDADAGFAYYEYKYLVSNENLSYVKAVLDSLYGGSDPYPEGSVDSIYYDTQDRKLYRECLNGEPLKHKFRVRGYGDGSFGQLHLKEKVLFGVSKQKAKIRTIGTNSSRLPSWDEVVSNYDIDENYEKINILASQFGSLHPAIRVRYYRYRYRVYDYRITLDTKIEVFGVDELNDKPISYGILPNHVLEIKTRGERPHLPMLGLAKLPQVSFSKFFLGINHLEHTTVIA